MGKGGVAHLHVVYGCQGAEGDPEKLALTDQLLTSVLAEAKMCCSGQPVILVEDLNEDPLVVPSLAKGIPDGGWIDLEQAFAIGRGDAPTPTCQFQLDESEGTRRAFALVWSVPTHQLCPLLAVSSWISRSHSILLSVRSFRGVLVCLIDERSPGHGGQRLGSPRGMPRLNCPGCILRYGLPLDSAY